jgi:hypothetical protein
MRSPAGDFSTASATPKCRSMSSVWSRVGSGSTTVVMPGELRPASSTADLICAEATGSVYSTGIGSRAPITASGRRPPSRATMRAPNISSGFATRAIGRPRRLASPVKKLVKGWVATTPISRRVPGPALPMSSTSAGSARPPSPRPRTRQIPVRAALDLGAHRAHRGGGAQHILALEQAADRRLADRQAAEHQRAMRDRFVAGRAQRAVQAASGAPCRQRKRRGGCGQSVDSPSGFRVRRRVV